MTIPQLELMAAHIGSKSLQFVANALPSVVKMQMVWSDSQCVLHWLNSEKPLTVFVRNRASELVTSTMWCHGPAFLCDQNEDNWPKFELTTKNPMETETLVDLAEQEQSHVSSSMVVHEQLPSEGPGTIIDYRNFSSFTKLLRITTWCRRAVSKVKPSSKELTAKEIHQAKLLWIRYIQKICYTDVHEALQTKKYHSLSGQLGLLIDNEGIIRCGCRLQHSQLTESAIHPILLPKNDYFTTLIIRSFHEKAYHAGVSHTLSNIRNEYWIPAGRATVFKIIHSCIKCKRYDGGPYKAPNMPGLPASRVTPSSPFTITRFDYLGPLHIKQSEQPGTTQKTCLATHAIHLELVPDMSAEQFLMCLRRFFSRRGVPTAIISDNASQFKLVKSVLDKVWSTVTKDSTVSPSWNVDDPYPALVNFPSPPNQAMLASEFCQTTRHHCNPVCFCTFFLAI